MSIRTRRLANDYAKLVKDLAASEFVSVRVVSGDPPNHYAVSYSLSGLAWDAPSGTTRPVTVHEVDIVLPMGYPKQAPRCTMRTPIWHPNIGDYVCIGDYWSAGVTLVDIIAHIGDMIQYKTFNLRSPVNKAAAAWAERNARSFPIGTRQLVPGDDATPAKPLAVYVAPSQDLDISLGPVRERR